MSDSPEQAALAVLQQFTQHRQALGRLCQSTRPNSQALVRAECAGMRESARQIRALHDAATREGPPSTAMQAAAQLAAIVLDLLPERGAEWETVYAGFRTIMGITGYRGHAVCVYGPALARAERELLRAVEEQDRTGRHLAEANEVRTGPPLHEGTAKGRRSGPTRPRRKNPTRERVTAERRSKVKELWQAKPLKDRKVMALAAVIGVARSTIVNDLRALGLYDGN